MEEDKVEKKLRKKKGKKLDVNSESCEGDFLFFLEIDDEKFGFNKKLDGMESWKCKCSVILEELGDDDDDN